MSYILNTFPGAFAAYSLRKLKSGTLDTVITIQRESDNEFLPIGFTPDGNLDTESITSFCTGTICRVTELKDQVGTAHLSQSTLANAPIIYESGALITSNTNRVALKFSTNQRLVSTSTYTANSLRDFSYFLAHAQTGSYVNTATIVSLPETDIKRTASTTLTIVGASNPLNNNVLFNSNVVQAIFAARDSSLKVTRLGVSGLQSNLNETLVPQTTARNIVIGSNQSSQEYSNILFQELVYYRANRIDIRNEFETQASHFYMHINKNRSRLDTIADSFDKPLLGYSLRIIGAEKIHPVVNNLDYTTAQFIGSTIIPLIRVRRGTSQTDNSGVVEVYPDIYGEVSLNSKVIVVTGTITFSKPIYTLGEFLGNPYYSATGATHYNGYIERWYEQFLASYTPSLGEGYMQQTNLLLQPIIYLNNSGLVKLNNKPAIRFNGAHKLEASLSSTYVGHPFVNNSTTITGLNSGFIVNAILGIISSNVSPAEVVAYQNSATQSIVNIMHGTDTNKFTSSTANTTGTTFTDSSKNTVSLNAQYLISIVRSRSRFYVTADGSSDAKVTVNGTMRDSTGGGTTNKLIVGDVVDAGQGPQFYIQEVSNFKRSGEAYKLDIEEEIKRHYNIATLNSNLNLVGIKYAPQLVLGYALRKISNASSNHLISIRRSDGVEVSVFADLEGRVSYESGVFPTTVEYKNLGAFAAGYDCFVTRMVDQINVASTRDMTQTTAAQQPQIYSATDGLILFNGLPAIRFDGSDDRINVNNSISISTANCAVASVSSASGNGILFSGINTEISNSVNRAVELRYGVTSSNWGFSVATSPFTHTPVVMQANSASAHHIGIANYHSSGGYASALAGEVLTTSTAATATNQQISTFSIGYVPTGSTTGSNFFSGFLQELLVFGSNQETDKVDIVEIANDYYKVF